MYYLIQKADRPAIRDTDHPFSQASHGHEKSWKTMENENIKSRPGKVMENENFAKGHGIFITVYYIFC